jgi:hypothetical protein
LVLRAYCELGLEPGETTHEFQTSPSYDEILRLYFGW